MEVLNELALFAGGGGGILASQLLGWRTRCAVEIDPYCRQVLLARQKDKILEPFPIWDDIRTFDPTPWKGFVDVISGGFPCQDISSAGKGAGITGSRSGLVFEMLSIVNEVRPRHVFAENSPNLRTRGLGSIVAALDGMGYDVRWCVLGAWHVGAPHKRNRMWILATNIDSTRDLQPERGIEGERGRPSDSGRDVADTNEGRLFPLGKGLKKTNFSWVTNHAPRCCENVADSQGTRLKKDVLGGTREEKSLLSGDAVPWPTEPDVGRVAHGVARRVDRLKALGNGQVPRVAATAWRILRGIE